MTDPSPSPAAQQDLDFSFPVLPPPKVPLTARATVTDRSAPQGETSRPAAPAAVALADAAKRNRVPLEKGFSQVDWIRLTRKEADLAGLGGAGLRKNISHEEVKQHASKEDAWLILRGKVYNISPYLNFHPGGAAILMREAGKDGTEAFQKYHPWVNVDALLAKCLVGWAEAPAAAPGGPAGGAPLPQAAAQGRTEDVAVQ